MNKNLTDIIIFMQRNRPDIYDDFRRTMPFVYYSALAFLSFIGALAFITGMLTFAYGDSFIGFLSLTGGASLLGGCFYLYLRRR